MNKRSTQKQSEEAQRTRTSHRAWQSNLLPAWEAMRSEHGEDKQKNKRELTH